MAFSNQSDNSNFRNGGGESAANIVTVHERVFSTEQGTKYGSGETSAAKRTAVRVIKFENPQGLRVGFSNQWFATDLGRWLPSKKGHIFFSFKAWRDLVASINTIDEQLKCGFSGDGYDDDQQVGSNGGRMGHDTQRPSNNGQSTRSNAPINSAMSSVDANSATHAGATSGRTVAEEAGEKAETLTIIDDSQQPSQDECDDAECDNTEQRTTGRSSFKQPDTKRQRAVGSSDPLSSNQ
jgi:hypothetical protein